MPLYLSVIEPWVALVGNCEWSVAVPTIVMKNSVQKLIAKNNIDLCSGLTWFYQFALFNLRKSMVLLEELSYPNTLCIFSCYNVKS